MKFAKSYEPNQYEPTVYALWEKSGVFEPKGEGEPYSIVMPPPNANGNLHIGHGLTIALQDILTRYHRMRGYDTIYIPGADHAGFETWVVYERALEQIGQSRFDFSRDQLYSQVWNFVEEQRGNMELQIRTLGASCDWKELVFTLDKKVVKTVYGTFKKLWDDGLVYRGERIVNYCIKHQTSFADIEVVHKEEKGILWDIAYPLVDGEGEIVVSTTRPETILGDTAVAVDPDDERYKDLIGKYVEVPLTGRNVPIIADDYVDENFGTGAVKITPAHDPNDFEIGERHDLERITVIGFDGKMTENALGYAGIDSIEAREKILNDLEEAGLRRGEKPIVHSVGHCYKCDSVVEPLLKEQWFLNVKPLAKRAIEAVEAGEIEFTPKSKKKALVQYLVNLRDWNLSRQIPWGIPIPAFRKDTSTPENTPSKPSEYTKRPTQGDIPMPSKEGGDPVALAVPLDVSAKGNGLEEGFLGSADDSEWIFDERVEDEKIVVNGTTYIRDEDTFDTWFSSGQWPFITTDYLGEDSKLGKFYPLDVMETGSDLLHQWVARMVMLGLYATDKIPFKAVYMHGMVLDEKGQKMSKSKGNVINPIEVIGEYGSDAFRLGIVASRSAGQNQAFSTSKVVAGRNMCNKLWNIARFIQDTVGDDFIPGDKLTDDNMGEDWILAELMDAKHEIEKLVKEYRFSEAGEKVYQVIWNSVADWFIESQKLYKNKNLMAKVLETCLKIAHPFAPFVTETIWQNLSWTDSILAGESWPEEIEYDVISAANFGRLKKLVVEARYVMNELPGKKKYKLLYQNDILVDENRDLIKLLTRVPEVEAVDQPRGMRMAASGREVWLDVDAKTVAKHKANLEERIEAAKKEVETFRARLENENYVNKAPEHLVAETRNELEYKEKVVARLEKELEVI